MIVIDGALLKLAVVAAARELLYRQEELDQINVFPVPDGDTGTNMALTMRDVAECALECRESSVGGMTRELANAALLNARGNSGAILAQFFQGLAEGLRDQRSAALAVFAAASSQASQSAYEAVADPREGTILTVMRDWSSYLGDQSERSGDFVRVFRGSLAIAETSMRKNAKHLSVLVQAGVIDAGALGFVSMLEGVVRLMRSGSVDLPPRRATRVHAPSRMTDVESEYRFCTQVIVDRSTASVAVLTGRLRPLGDSIVVVRSESKARVHIHTNDPTAVNDVLREFGDPREPDVEDMWAQRAATTHPHDPAGIILITDSSCDLPAGEIIRNRIRVVPFQVTFGDETFIDKVTITEREFYGMLEASSFHPKTSQPTPAEFLASCRQGEIHRDAVIVTVSAGLSGTWQAAQLASRTLGDKVRLHVVDSKSVSAGLALIVREAARIIGSGASVEEVLRHVESARLGIRFFIIVDTVEFLARGGRLPKLQARIARLLGVKPLLALDEEGKPRVVARSLSSERSREKLVDMVIGEARRMRRCEFIVAHARAQPTAEQVAERLRASFGTNSVTVTAISPALGVHVGPGAVAVALSDTG